MPNTLEGWLQHIERISPNSVNLGLDRISKVWSKMDVCLGNAVLITVGGTNGKGSCTAIMESILNHSGYRTMRYSSPHLLRYSERVRIAGEEASESMLCKSFAKVEDARNRCENTELTYFEFGTLAAMWCAAHHECQTCVLEIGLGGRLDAVNLFDADVSVITTVDIDHVEYLGSEREQIGWEKAHIMRNGRPVVLGERTPPASILDYAEKIEAKVTRLGKDFGFELNESHSWNYIGKSVSYRSLPLPSLAGKHQLINSATALAALEAVGDRLPLAVSHIRQGLLSTDLKGRMQIMPEQPVIVLDVAHNPSSAQILADGLLDMGYFPRTVGIFGIMADKDIRGVVQALSDRIDLWLTVPLDSLRSSIPQETARLIRDMGGQAEVCDSVAQALSHAKDNLSKRDRMVLFGSFLTVSQYMALSSN